MGTLFEFAFKGVNLIPTILFILILVYWITVIIGVLDFDFLDFDMDFDLDAGDGLEGIQGLLAFLNLKDMPVMIVFSVITLIFWVISMLLYFLPITHGGWINGICLIPAFVVSIMLTKIITNPLKGIFSETHENAKGEKNGLIGEFVTMTTNLTGERIGQAEARRDGASILVNVKCDIVGETIKKGEEVYVTRKDDRDIYYIIKLQMK